MFNSRRQEGYTLIELLFVVIIIGLLASIAVPVYSAARIKAKDSAGIVAWRTVIGTINSWYLANGETFGGLKNAMINSEEASLDASPTVVYTPGSSADPSKPWIGTFTGQQYGVAFAMPANAQQIVICSVTKGDTTYCVADDRTTGVKQYKMITLPSVITNTPGGPQTPSVGTWKTGGF